MKRGADTPEVETVETNRADGPESCADAGNGATRRSGGTGGDKVETEWRHSLSIPSSAAPSPARKRPPAVRGRPLPGTAGLEKSRANDVPAPTAHEPRNGAATLQLATKAGARPAVRALGSGLVVDRERYYYADVYRGSRTDLIAAGVMREGEFPGDQGNKRTQVTLLPDGSPCRQGARGRMPGARCVRKCGRDRFEVQVFVSADECTKRGDVYFARFEREHQDRLAKAKAEEGAVLLKGWIERLPGSESEFREKQVDIFLCPLSFQLEWMEGHSKGGFKYSLKAMSQIKAQLERLRLLMMNAPIEFNAQDLQNEIAALEKDAHDRFGTGAHKRPELRLIT